MLIHSFDPRTGQYQSSMLAMTDPVDPTRWLMPAFTTEVALPYRPPRTWPFFVQGSWEMRDDWRGVMLYRRDNGDAAEIFMAGISLDQAQLTPDPRPDELHKWVGDAWALDAEAVALRVFREAQARADAGHAKVRDNLYGKHDAYIAGLLSPLEVGAYKAWAGYGLTLANFSKSPDFPDGEWPVEPTADSIAALVAADLEASAKKQAEEAEARAALEKSRLPYGGDAEAKAAARATFEAKRAKE